jgi:hypothetical protein
MEHVVHEALPVAEEEPAAQAVHELLPAAE